jgi:hypothetical protein
MSTADETRKHILACARILRDYYTAHGHEMWELGNEHADRIASAACDARQALDAALLPSKRMLALIQAETTFCIAKTLARAEDSRNGLPYLQSVSDVAVADAITWARSLVADEVRALETAARGSKPRTSRPPR